MRRRRYRPFGVLGSVLEVAIGVYLLWGILGDAEEYGRAFATVVVVLGVAIVAAGVIGIVASLLQKFQMNRD